MIINGILGPFGRLTLITIYFLVLITSIYLILKKEKSYRQIIWLLISLFIPLIGGIIYIIKYFIEKNIYKKITN